MKNIKKILLGGAAALMLSTSAQATLNSSCYGADGKVMQWAVNALEMKGHGEGLDEKGDQMTVHSPEWIYYKCDKVRKTVHFKPDVEDHEDIGD